MVEAGTKSRICGARRGSATKTLLKHEDTLAMDSSDVTRLVAIKMSLQEKLTRLYALDMKILGLLKSEDNSTRKIEQSDAFKRDILAALVRIHRLPTSSLDSVPSSALLMATRVYTWYRQQDQATKIDNNTFNGDPTIWTTFWDLYKATIEENSSLCQVVTVGLQLKGHQMLCKSD